MFCGLSLLNQIVKSLHAETADIDLAFPSITCSASASPELAQLKVQNVQAVQSLCSVQTVQYYQGQTFTS
jgi:hypothetical protein